MTDSKNEEKIISTRRGIQRKETIRRENVNARKVKTKSNEIDDKRRTERDYQAEANQNRWDNSVFERSIQFIEGRKSRRISSDNDQNRETRKGSKLDRRIKEEKGPNTQRKLENLRVHQIQSKRVDKERRNERREERTESQSQRNRYIRGRDDEFKQKDDMFEGQGGLLGT